MTGLLATQGRADFKKWTAYLTQMGVNPSIIIKFGFVVGILLMLEGGNMVGIHIFKNGQTGFLEQHVMPCIC